MPVYTLTPTVPAEQPAHVTLKLAVNGSVHLLIDGVSVAFLTTGTGNLGLPRLGGADRVALGALGIAFNERDEIQTY